MGQLRHGAAALLRAAALRTSPLLAPVTAPALAAAALHGAGTLALEPQWRRAQQGPKAGRAAVDLHSFHTGLPRCAEAVRKEDVEDGRGGASNSEKVHPAANESSQHYDDGYIAPHPGSHGAAAHSQGAPTKKEAPAKGQGQGQGQAHYWLMQPIYSEAYVNSIKPRHKVPTTLTEKTGFWAVTALRSTFDLCTGYSKKPGAMTEAKWLFRIIFLETTAGVPGMVGAMMRHLRSLRSMRRDHGWIHTLLEEAENERMHLLTFIEFAKPGPVMRGAVLATQGIFMSLYTLFYAVSPKHCHAFVGYLEEEAVKTYTHCLEDIDGGHLWKGAPATEMAKRYWGLKEDATMRDVVAAVRADEACHSHVNHTFSDIPADTTNPFSTGAHEVP